MAKGNLLVNGKNNITARANAMADIQNLRNTASNAQTVNTPNLPNTSALAGLKKAQQPVQTRLDNLNAATGLNVGVGGVAPMQPNTKPVLENPINTATQGTIQSNNPAFNNGALITPENQPSRFIGFQNQQPVLEKTANERQGLSWSKMMSGGYAYVPSELSKAESSNRIEEERFRTMSEAFYDLQGDLYKRGQILSDYEIQQKYPEFKNLDKNVLKELQNELLPIVKDGMGVDADQLSQYYPELLKGKELKDIDKVKADAEKGNQWFTNWEKALDRVAKSGVGGMSSNGVKSVEDAKIVRQAVQAVKKNGVVGGGSDYEILKSLYEKNPEIKQLMDEFSSLELTEKDKVIWGRSDAKKLQQLFYGITQPMRQAIVGKSEFMPDSEELQGLQQKAKAFEDDYWGQVWGNVRTQARQPYNSFEKFLYRMGKDAKLWSIDDIDEYLKQSEQNEKDVKEYNKLVDYEQNKQEEQYIDPAVRDYYNSHRMSESLALGDLKGFVYKGAGEAAGNWEMPVVIAASVVQPEVGFALMATDTYVRESEDAFEQLIDAGASYDDAEQVSVLVGLASTAVELGLEKALGGVETTASTAIREAIMKDFSTKAADMAAQRGIGELIKQGLVTQARSSFEEGLEEILQQGIQNYAVSKYDPDQKITEGLLEAFEGGFFNPMNLLAGGGEVMSNVDVDAINQQAYNAGVKTRQIVDNAKDSLNRGAYNAGAFLGNITEDFKNNVTQGGKGNKQIGQQPGTVNTTSENQNNINGDNYNQNVKNNKTLNKVQLGMLQNDNRMNPSKITEFKDKFGKDYGQALADMGYTESWETNVPKIEQDTKEIYNQKKEAMNSVQGEFKDRSLSDMLEIMLQKAKNTKDYDMIDKYEALTEKHNTKGLTMAEANDMREEFSYKIKTKWGQENNSDKIDLADNVYLAVKKFLETTAEQNGIKDLQQMNRDIAMRKYLSTWIGDKAERQSANNMVSLTDWVILAEAVSNPYAAAGFAAKKIAQQPKVKNAVLNAVVGRRQNRAIDTRNRQAANKQRLESIESANKGKQLQQQLSAPETPALPNGIKLTKVTEIDARTKNKPKNNVTKKNNNKKSDNGDDGTTPPPSGGTPTGNGPTNTNPTGTNPTTKGEDNTKKESKPKKKNEVTGKKEEVTSPKPKEKPQTKEEAIKWYKDQIMRGEKIPEDVLNTIPELKEAYEARQRGISKPNGALIYTNSEFKYIPSVKEGLIRLSNEEGKAKLKEQLDSAFDNGFELTALTDSQTGETFVYNTFRTNDRLQEIYDEWDKKPFDTVLEEKINKEDLESYEIYNGEIRFNLDPDKSYGETLVIADLKDFLNDTFLSDYVTKGAKRKITDNNLGLWDTFEDIDKATLRELIKRGDDAAIKLREETGGLQDQADIELYDNMTAEDRALEEMYQEILKEENETPQDIDYQELAELENETPQIIDEEMNRVTKKQPEKPKNLVTNPQFETLPKDVPVAREAKKEGPKRIAPDRIRWQQLTPEEGISKVTNEINKRADYYKAWRDWNSYLKSPNRLYDDGPEKLRQLAKAKDEKAVECGHAVYNLGFRGTRSGEFQSLSTNIRNAINYPTEELTRKQLDNISKGLYESRVRSDLRRGYVYPQEVLDAIPGAKKAVDSRAIYQKGLDTAFSAKDSRIDYSAKDKIGGGMKRQDGKKLTEEQKNEIVKGVMDFQKVFGINMKKMAEDMGIVYVHVNGKNVFMSNASGMFRRTYNDDGTVKNASVSIGGVEKVRRKDKDTGEWHTDTANTIMSHELGHVVDFAVDNNLIVGGDLVDLMITYKGPSKRGTGYANYLRNDKEIRARAFEQYMAVEKGAGESYFDKVGYWNERNYNLYVKPIVEKAVKEKLGDWYINPDDVKYQKTNVLANDRNKVTRGQKSENKLLKQVLDDAKQAEKTGLIKKTITVESTKDLFNLINGTTEQPRYQSVWHGSLADFDSFDSSHMGEGEGAQAHGWGHYFAVNENTARHYAELKRYPNEVTIKGKTITNPQDLRDVPYFERSLYEDIFSKYAVGYNDLDEESFNEIKERRRHDYEVTIDYLQNLVDNPEKPLVNDVNMDYMREERLKQIEGYKDMLEKLDELELSDIEVNRSKDRSNLYKVDIPDQKKANTPTRSNYLEEDYTLNEKEANRMAAAIDKYAEEHKGNFEFQDPIGKWRFERGEIDEGTLDNYTYENLKKEADILRLAGMVKGDILLQNLQNALGDKGASKFLESIGYDGIHYYGGRDGEAYVIFGDDTADIVEHIKYLKDNQGNVAGAVLPDGTMVLVKDAIRADTAWHETSHRLYSFAKENSPELYNAITKIAEEAPQELKDYVKDTYGDMSPESFIDEVFAWRQGRYSSVKGAEKWYQRMWNAIKRLWNNIKSKFGKQYADLSVFEGWEKMNSEQLMRNVDDLLKGGKEIGNARSKGMRGMVEGDGKAHYDNRGNLVSSQMENYMKKSKAREDESLDNPLVEVYHTTTNLIVPFSEFNPVGTEGYRFGKDVVNYYTDDKDMSGSYAHQNYKTYEGKANLYTRADVDNFIKEINEGDYHNYVNKEKLNYEIREVGPEDGLGKDTKYGVYQRLDTEKFDKLKKIIDKLTPEEYKLYLNAGKRGSVRDYIENDTDIQYWNGSMPSREATELTEKYYAVRAKIEELSEEEGLDRFDIYDYEPRKDQTNGKRAGLKYKSERELIRRIEDDVKYKINGPSRRQYEGYVNITNPYIVDAEGRNWNTVRLESRYLNETKEKWSGLSKADKDRIIKTVKTAKDTFELAKAEDDAYNWFDYSEENQELGMAMGEVFPEEFLIELADMEWAGDSPIQHMVDAILNGMSDSDIAKVIGSGEGNETTNDVVKSILRKNKNGETNYDGIIIKNVIDYGGKSENKPAPHNLYITFNSNQFKSRFNEFPTEDPDIRYEQAGIKSPEFKKWFEGSKIVNKNGTPKVMYHGTPYGGFTVFAGYNRGSIGDDGYFGKGFYFTSDKATARDYSDEAMIDPEERTTEPGQYGNVEIKEVYLDVKNPYIVEEKNVEYDMGQLEKLLGTKNPAESTEKLQSEGYDGVIYRFNNGHEEVTVFEPTQIKSATDNIGTYDKNNPDIRYQRGDGLPMTPEQKADYVKKLKRYSRLIYSPTLTRDDKFHIISRMNYMASEIKDKLGETERKDKVNALKHRFAMQEIRIKGPEVIKRDSSTKDKYGHNKQPGPYLEYNGVMGFHVDNDVRDEAQRLKKKGS